MQKTPTNKPSNAGKSNPSVFRQCRIALKRHYTAPLILIFKQFRAGLIYFAVGMMSVLMANTYLTPSVQQELVILMGLGLGVIGFFMAILAEVRLLIARLIQFVSRKS